MYFYSFAARRCQHKIETITIVRICPYNKKKKDFTKYKFDDTVFFFCSITNRYLTAISPDVKCGRGCMPN